MKGFAFFQLFCIISIGAFSQSSFLPMNLGDSINSYYSEINPVLAPDGKTIYFIRENHPENTYGERDSQDIWTSTQINDSTWTKAKRIPELNIVKYNAVVSVFSNGNALLLKGVYNKNGTFWNKRGFSISYKYGEKWGSPTEIKIRGFSRINSGIKSSGFMSEDGNSLVLSFSKVFNGKKNDLFFSTKNSNGVWKKPVKIKSLSSRSSEDAPFLSSDNKTIYFSSDRGTKNQFDIYKAEQSGDDFKNWTIPAILSETIDSPSWESDFKTNSKGSWAYFSSDNAQKRSIEKGKGNNARPNFYGKADIYKVQIFEDNPFVLVSGTIFNETTKKPLKGIKFDILINGKSADSLKINTDSATYKLKLPLGKSYDISSSIKGYKPATSKLDVSKVKEFTKKTVDLAVAPPSDIVIKGRMLVQPTNLPIAASFKPMVLANNESIKSLKLDLVRSTYEVKLPLGKVYDLRVKADKHESVVQTFDLRKMNDFSDIEMNLYVSKGKLAIIRGRIIDKKTNKPFARLSQAKINVEGIATVTSSIDTITGSYELKLPLSSSYTINASAPNYYPIYESINIGNDNNNIIIYKDLVIVPVEVGQSIRLNNIFFDTGKSTLKPASFPELNRVVEYLFKNQKLVIEIDGHTDNVGSIALNQSLSLNRAKAVANYLVKEGIARTRLFAKGYGPTKPVASNKTSEGKALNRRVEFTVLRNN